MVEDVTHFYRSDLKRRFSNVLRRSTRSTTSPIKVCLRSVVPTPSPPPMPCPREVELALRYLQQVISSNSPTLIQNSTTALLDAIAVYCDNTDHRLQGAVVSVLQDVDKLCLESDCATATNNIRNVVERLAVVLADVELAPKQNASTSGKASTNDGSYSPHFSHGKFDHADSTSYSNFNDTQGSAQEQNLDDLLKQLNIRQVPKFSPVFADLDVESDDDTGMITDERKEERAEKHGKKMCEEEVQKLADGTEVRTKSTKTVNVQQSSKQVFISTRGGGCPAVSRKFTDGTRSMNETEDNEKTDFFGGRDPFDSLRKRSQLSREMPSLEMVSPGQSTKTKTVEQTSEISQSVSQKKERNGRVLGEQAASKLDSSELKAKQTDTFLGERLLDRKGEGSYEENSILHREMPSVGGPPPAPPPRKHVVEYIQTFGNKEDTDEDFFRGTTLSSYIVLNDNLRFHEEQFRKKVQFEFSSAGASITTPDFGNLAELLQGEIGSIKLPTKFAQDEQEEEGQQLATDWLSRHAIQYPSHFEPDTICLLDATEYLVMRSRDDAARPTEVRGGPRDALIVYATQSGVSMLYQEAFLVTYRTFITTNDLINKLVKRYLFMTMSSDRASQSAARHTFSVIVRVVDELAPVEIQQNLVTSVTSFVYRLIRDGNFTFARILRRRLLEKIEQPRVANGIISKLSPPRKPPTLFDFRSVDLACQITLIDAELFQLIEPAELLWWAQELDEKKSPNLVRFTEHFNNVSFWVRTLVINQNSQKEREKYMNKFIKVMKQLRRLNNFNSYLAILSALVSSPLCRLEWSKSILDQLKDHSTIMDSSSSYKNYRALLQNAKPPSVPYVGVVLQDLTFVHAGNTDKLQPERCGGRKEMVNFLKRWHQYAILDSVRKLKRWNYDFVRDEKVILFFDGFRNFLSEEATWERSHSIKAPNRRRP